MTSAPTVDSPSESSPVALLRSALRRIGGIVLLLLVMALVHELAPAAPTHHAAAAAAAAAPSVPGASEA